MIYPDFCAGCNQQLLMSEKGVCSSCWIELKPFQFNNNKPAFFGRQMVCRELYAFEFIKNEILQKILHNIKYKGNKEAAFVLGIELGKILLKYQNEIDVIIPVPVSDKKKINRGFNQSEYIARGVQNILDKPVLNNYLVRKNNMNSQTKSKRFQRWQNVESQYITKVNSSMEFENVLLVDDVMTSGATIHSCLGAFQTQNIKFTVAALAARKRLL